MEAQSAAVVPPAPPNLIITVLPPDPLKMIFKALPASHLFVAPVCRQFRDLYGDATKEKFEKHATYKYSITTEAALVQYLETKELRYTTREDVTSMIGAGCGRTDWVERGGVFAARTCESAAKGGQLGVLKWLRGLGCPWNIGSCKGAATYKMSSKTCSGAASNGHLEILQWARGEGCEWDKWTCCEAATNGHLEVLKWAIENGCPYTKRDLGMISDLKFHKWLQKYQSTNGSGSIRGTV